ncbi:MAG: diacylglycerol/lipid kinase family protein [Ramlibacter sp.]
MEARVVVVGNASAGNGATPAWRDIEAQLTAHGLLARVELVRDGHGIAAAVDHALAERASLVVAAGGDGTVSAVASRLVGTGTPLGVLPVGTLNHFAKDLGLPLDLEAAIDVLAAGHAIGVDVGEVNGRTFVNNSSIGLYPRIVLDRERQRREARRGKWTALVRACLHAALRYPVLQVEVEVAGQRLERRSPFVFIGNNRYHVEGFDIGQRTSLRDGLLSLYLARDSGRFNLVRLAALALVGRLRQADDFEALDAAAFVITTRRKRVHVALDGEVAVLQAPLRYRIRAAGLQVLVPPPAA